MAIQLDEMCTAPADTAKLLGTVFDLHLDMNAQVNNVRRTCTYHPYQRGKVRRNKYTEDPKAQNKAARPSQTDAKALSRHPCASLYYTGYPSIKG